MNLLVLCPHFAPDVAPTGEVITSITGELAAGVIASTSSRRCRGTGITASRKAWEGKAVRRQVTDWGASRVCSGS